MKATLVIFGGRVTLTGDSRDLGYGKQLGVIYSDGVAGWEYEENLTDMDEEAEELLKNSTK